MEDVVILLHEEDLQDHIPPNTHRIFISSVNETIDSSAIFIRSTVKKRWATQKTRNASFFKAILADGEHDADSINVYFMGPIAEQCGIIDVGDTVILSSFFIENSTNPACSTHEWQLVLDQRRTSPVICILHGQQKQQQNVTPLTTAIDLPSSPVASSSKQSEPSAVSTLVASTTVTISSDVTSIARPLTVTTSSGTSSMARPATVTTSSNTTTVSSSTSRPRPPAEGQGPKVTTNYTYKKIKDLVRDTVVNVYGIIKFVKQPFRTRGTDYMMLVSIVDPSTDNLSDKLKCVLFAREQNMFPAEAEVGDIIRMHRLKISEFNGDLQGKNGPGFSFLLFDNKNASLTPKFKSTNHYTITEEDYNRVTELRTWWSSLQLQDPDEETPLPRSISLADVQCGAYFDLTCQVVGVCAMSPREGCLLKVWDGTKASVSVYNVETGEREVQYDVELARKAVGFIVDVCVFDDHFVRGAYCKPGNFVKLYNLHAMKHKVAQSEESSAVPTVEMCLHGGTSYGRGIRIFDEAEKQVEGLKKRLENVKTDINTTLEERRFKSLDSEINESSPGPLTRKLPNETICQEIRRSARLKLKSAQNISPQKRGLDASPSTSGKRRQEDGGTSSGTPRCMTNTATVIVGHYHIPHSSIRDIESHSVPYKFRVQARLMDYKPKVNTARDMLRLYCPKCNFLSPLPESKAAIDSPNIWAATASAHDIQDGIPLFLCPTKKCNQEVSAVSRILEYIYTFQLILFDGTGYLVVELIKDEAETFFNDLPAKELLRKRKTFNWLQAKLRELCPSRGEDTSRPLLELCIKSYTTSDTHPGYRIFDTTLAAEED